MSNRPSKIAFIDTETTGLSPLNRPWEIAVILRETLPPADNGDTVAPFDTEYLYQVEYTSRTLPEGTDPDALRLGGWRERAWGLQGAEYRAGLDDQGVHTAVGPEWSIARSLNKLLEGATLVGVGVHFDAETLGRMFLRHGLPWQPWHYGIIDLKAATWGWCRGSDEMSVDTEKWDRIPVSSETVAGYFTDPPTAAERHTALGDARWARRWFDAL